MRAGIGENMKDRINHRFGFSLLCGLLLSTLPLSTAAAQIPVKENIDFYNIAPDLCPSGTEEELDKMTFHSVLLPEELKDNGITIALSVPGKGRIHYSVGVDSVYSAAVIRPEVSEDAEGEVPVINRYESDEVYDYYYNFDTSKKGTYYVKLTAPDDAGTEDISIRFSAQFYSGADRNLVEGVQAFCAVTDDIPVTYSVTSAEAGTLVVTTDNYSKEHPPALHLYGKNGEIKATGTKLRGSALATSYQAEAGKYQIKVTNESDFYRIRYELLDSYEQRGDVPKTGEVNEAWLYYGMAALCFGLLILIRIKDSDKTDMDYRKL